MRKSNKYVELNEKLFGRRIEQLDHILTDTNYIPTDSTNSYYEFIGSMYQALIGGRKITPNMESAITNIVKRYAVWSKNENDPKYREAKLNYIEESVAKIRMIRCELYKAKYHPTYESRSEYFLNSIENQVSKKGKLSVKQRKALNQMYKRFKKRIKKNENKA